jgi:ribulose-bisphosphate carboxylase large chain
MSKTVSSSGRVEVTYRLACLPAEAEALARKIAYEQTVELPEQQVTDTFILEHIVGRVENIHVEADHAQTLISFNPELCANNFSQLLILLFGNVSMFPGVRILDVRLPGSLLSQLDGPRFGIDGLRVMLGVYGRPLLATAIKPRGLSLQAMTQMAAAFARGGGDIIKDDQNLADDLETFKTRTDACQQAVLKANQQTGRNCLYFPHISAPAEQLKACFEHVQAIGARGVLACPMVIGMDTTRALAADHDLVLMAHPALAGSYTNSETQGIAHEILLGSLFRLAGADISIFPNHGGRFSFSRQTCESLTERLLEPLAGLKPSFPAPAGGMQFGNLGEMYSEYGDHAVLLLGGSLQAQHPDLEQGTRAFLDRIRQSASERLVDPQMAFVSACEIPAKASQVMKNFLAFNQGFNWEHRQPIDYKADQSLPFRGVRRVELMGQQGEQTAFDLRYFEIEPGGFTSLEKHQHTHVVIGVRGEGIVQCEEHRQILNEMDIAYIAPGESHQSSAVRFFLHR